jgi:hypothetical protein
MSPFKLLRLPDCATGVSNNAISIGPSGEAYRLTLRSICPPHSVRVRSKAVGLKLSIPVGGETQTVILSPRAQSVRLSLRTDDPAEVKARLAAVDAYLENFWRALREDAPASLTHRQATALAGELYHAWVNGEGRERTMAIVHTPGVGWQREYNTHVSDAEWEAVLSNWEKIGGTAKPSEWDKPLSAIGVQSGLEDSLGPTVDPSELEKPLGAIVDRLTACHRTVGGPFAKVDAELTVTALAAPSFREWPENRRPTAQSDTDGPVYSSSDNLRQMAV